MRVLRSGGKLVLAETFGNNRLLNGARRWRWKWSGQPDEAGEEIILDDSHIEILRRHFARVEVLAAQSAGHDQTAFSRPVHQPRSEAPSRQHGAKDKLLLAAAPALARYCGEVVVGERHGGDKTLCYNLSGKWPSHPILPSCPWKILPRVFAAN